jgi:hypothetical protein
MEIMIDGSRVDRDTVGYPPMGFGQQTFGLVTHEVELRFSTEEFRRLMQRPFDKFVAEIKADDEATESVDAIPELLQHNYADFETIFQASPRDVCRLIQQFLCLEMLEAAVGGVDPSRCKYGVNSIREFLCVEGSVLVRGIAYEVPRA